MSQKGLRVNEKIRIKEIRLIGPNGEQVGVIPTSEGMRMAQESGLDLVEVSPFTKPPVCRIMDYSKFKYEQEKKEKEARKKQRMSQIKEIRMKPKIGEHDYLTKLNFLEKFIKHGDKVKVTMIFRGREIAHMEFGRRILDRIMEDTKAYCEVEKMPMSEGRNIIMILMPK